MKFTFSLALTACALGAPRASAQAPYFFDLGAGYQATDVSTAGGTVVVVGTSFNSGGAFRWTPAGGIVEIGSTTYASGGYVRISRDGTKIVGEQDVSGISNAAFENGTSAWTAIPGIGGSSSGNSTTCNAINSDGTVLAGLGWVNGGTAHAYRWTSAGNVDLMPFFNSPSSRAFGISGDGSIVVGWENNLANQRRAARWQGGVRTFFTYTDPGNVVRDLGECQAINDAGTIAVGNVVVGVSGFNGWRWDSSANAVTLLPNLPGAATNAYPTDVIDDGSMIVGTDGANILVGATAIIWQNNVPQNLFSYLLGLGMTGTGTYTGLGLPQAISPEGGVIVGRGLSFGGNHPSGWVVVFPQFLPIGTPFCAGDGSGAACPCANTSPVGDEVGCVSSLSVGGKLRGSGVASVSVDTLVLTSTQVPNGPALYFQGDARFAGGAGIAFGDGLLCAGGSIIRIGVEFSTGGNQSSYPGPGDVSLSVMGGVAAGNVVHYQAWYRDAVVGYCTPSVFNLTNGLTINWTL